jgi:hypothetical protein
MKDKRSIINLCLLIINSLIFILYQYELFWGKWAPFYTKGLFYLWTVIILLYFVFDEIKGYDNDMHKKIKLSYLIWLAITFIFFFLALTYKIKNDVGIWLIAYNLIVISIFSSILINGIRHKIFNNS